MEPSEPSGFILDVIVDKTITSGGRLFHRGRYIDLSLKSRIEDLINKEDVIRKYL
jgi:F0F1-type ATP synthase delta subunit